MFVNRSIAIALALHGAPLRVPKGAVIFHSGEDGEGVYIVRAGRIVVSLPNRHGFSLWSRTVAEYAILGLSASFGHRPHALRAIASESSELVFVPSPLLEDIVAHDGFIGQELLVLISQELSAVRKFI